MPSLFNTFFLWQKLSLISRWNNCFVACCQFRVHTQCGSNLIWRHMLHDAFALWPQFWTRKCTSVLLQIWARKKIVLKTSTVVRWDMSGLKKIPRFIVCSLTFFSFSAHTPALYMPHEFRPNLAVCGWNKRLSHRGATEKAQNSLSANRVF